MTATPPDNAAAPDAPLHALETAVSRLLRWSVIVSLTIVLIGLTATFLRHPDYTWSPGEWTRLASDNASFPKRLPDVFSSAVQLRGRGLVLIGVVLLVLTPLMRVALSVVAFTLQRDWAFALVTAIVLTLLILSFRVGTAA